MDMSYNILNKIQNSKISSTQCVNNNKYKIIVLDNYPVYSYIKFEIIYIREPPHVYIINTNNNLLYTASNIVHPHTLQRGMPSSLSKLHIVRDINENSICNAILIVTDDPYIVTDDPYIVTDDNSLSDSDYYI